MNLLHVVIKDHENSGFVYDEFYCPDCLKDWVMKFEEKEILRREITTPQWLSRLYPPLVNEPHCDRCGLMFRMDIPSDEVIEPDKP